jgi:hypothetical protein
MLPHVIPTSPPIFQEPNAMRYLIGMTALYVVAGWLIVGLPHGECTSEQRAHDPDGCGMQAVIRQSLLWPWRLRQ